VLIHQKGVAVVAQLGQTVTGLLEEVRLIAQATGRGVAAVALTEVGSGVTEHLELLVPEVLGVLIDLDLVVGRVGRTVLLPPVAAHLAAVVAVDMLLGWVVKVVMKLFGPIAVQETFMVRGAVLVDMVLITMPLEISLSHITVAARLFWGVDQRVLIR
jgi:hypothetical protein